MSSNKKKPEPKTQEPPAEQQPEEPVQPSEEQQQPPSEHEAIIRELQARLSILEQQVGNSQKQDYPFGGSDIIHPLAAHPPDINDRVAALEKANIDLEAQLKEHIRYHFGGRT